MKQVIQSYKNGNISLAEVPQPYCKAGGVVVRTAASLISPGTEKMMIEMGQKSLLGKARARPDLVRQAWAKAQKEGFVSVFKEAMNRLDEPVPLGYSAAGLVVEVGAGVQGFAPGDRVAMAGAGYASHAEVVWVPENLCVRLPESVDFEEAAFVMLGGIALHGVREAGLTLGERAVVIGLGLLGLLSVQFLKSQGCRVAGVDLDPRKAGLAKELGADLVLVPGKDNVEEAIANFTGGLGADAVVITAASKDNRPLQLAETIARERARLVMVGVAELSLTRKAFWEKELVFTVSKAAGPGSLAPLYEAKGFDYPVAQVRWTERRNLEVFLDLVAQGRVRVKELISHRFPIDAALQAYDLLLKNLEPYIGVVLTYPEPDREALGPGTPRRRVNVGPAGPSPVGGASRGVGVIGGGMFTKNILLPALKQRVQAPLLGMATTTGVSAQGIAQKFGFKYATTDYREILQDADVGVVLITTRHNLHARLVQEALAAGKHVFVEKPLCLSEAELEMISQAYDGSRQLMVGFNRRFAPLTQELKAAFRGRATPLMMNYRVNAGFIPADHWVHDPEAGGGRLLGEVCHFVDFLCYLCDSEAVQVSAVGIGGQTGKYRDDDNLSLTVKFQDGSVGHILYSAQGSKSFSREYVEVFCEESVGLIEDFRKATMVTGAKTRKIKKLSMDMGYQAELAAFFKNLDHPEHFGDMFQSYVDSTLATLKAAEALRTGKPIQITEP
jgi:predicted dehydrogenase/threonine dehydrogenase-like Zn-dependent dehydrogenase